MSRKYENHEPFAYSITGSRDKCPRLLALWTQSVVPLNFGAVKKSPEHHGQAVDDLAKSPETEDVGRIMKVTVYGRGPGGREQRPLRMWQIQSH